eukprot:6211769-Pleurochrysis_carterae.AAC.1
MSGARESRTANNWFSRAKRYILASMAISLGYLDIADCVTGFDPRNRSPLTPQTGHGQAFRFTAVYADGEIGPRSSDRLHMDGRSTYPFARPYSGDVCMASFINSFSKTDLRVRTRTECPSVTEPLRTR